MRSTWLAILLAAAAFTGCVGSSDAGDDALNTSDSDRSTRNDTGDRRTTEDEGNTTSSETNDTNDTDEARSGNATQPDHGTDPTNQTPGPDPGTVIAEGHISAGSPTTYVYSTASAAGQGGLESFPYQLPEEVQPGTVLATKTTDNTGIGFNLDIDFHRADGYLVGGCADRPAPGEPGEQTCTVPEDAVQGTVDGVWGADLDVQLVVSELPGTDDGG